jgi:hypothetical protein
MKARYNLYWALGPEARSAMLAEWLSKHPIRGASVDKALLESCIAEASGDDAEMATFLRDRYSKNDALAAKFVGGYTRTQDYTQKTQSLAKERETMAGQTKQLETLRTQLEAAEADKSKIMKDLADRTISVSKARGLMQVLRDQYQLTDEDLPGMSDLIETSKKGKVVDSTDDIDARFQKFGEDLMTRMEKKFVDSLMPELGSMASLPIIWNDISREHQELTGKPITFAEQQDILKTARESNKPLRQVWEDKFQIAGDDGLRMKRRDENLRKGWESDREKADADKRSKQALEVVTGGDRQPDLGTGPGISPAFKTKFRQFDPDPNKPAIADQGGIPSLEVKPGQHVRQTGDRGPSGAQRAAQKFLEQRSAQATKVA